MLVKALFDAFPEDGKQNDQNDKGQRPGNGIGQQKDKHAAMGLENRGNPEQAENTGTHQADDHGKGGIADASQNTGHDIHDAAQGIRQHDDLHPLNAHLDDAGIR